MTGEVWAITSWGRRRAHRLGPVARTESALSVTTTAGELLAMSTFKRSLLRVRGLVVAAAIVPCMAAPANAQEGTTVLFVDVEGLQSGEGARNLELHDGDTIFVPGADTVYIFGEVRAPGEYPIRKTTTVLQALALAGGVTDFGATNRVRVIRVVDDEQQEIRVKLNDIVQAGDTLVVPKRFF